MTPSEDDEAKYNEARFLALISGLSGGAMQHLGKVVNPLTGKIEKDMQAAKGTIDILRMLREKTKGNLTDREEKTLNALLANLQLNYLDEATAEAEKPKEKPEEKPSEEKKEEKAEAKPEPEGKEEPSDEEKAEKPADVKKAEPSQEKKGEPAEHKEEVAQEKGGEPPADENKPPG